MSDLYYVRRVRRQLVVADAPPVVFGNVEPVKVNAEREARNAEQGTRPAEAGTPNEEHAKPANKQNAC